MENPFLHREHHENCPPVDDIWLPFDSESTQAQFFSPNRCIDLNLEAYRKNNPISSTPVLYSPSKVRSAHYRKLEQEDILRSEMYFADPAALRHLATPLHVRSVPNFSLDFQSPPVHSRPRAPQDHHQELFAEDTSSHPHRSSAAFFSPSPISASTKTISLMHQDLLDDESSTTLTPMKSCPFSPFSPILPIANQSKPADMWGNSIFSPPITKSQKSRKRSPTRSLFPFMRS